MIDFLLCLCTTLVLGAAVLVGATLVLHYFDGTGRDKPLPSPRAYLRTWWQETLAVVATVFAYPTGWWIRNASLEAHTYPHGPVIILVHGWGLNSSCFWLMRRRLQQTLHGRAFTLRARPSTGDLDSMAESLLGDIRDLASRTSPDRPWIAVGHGVGGLLLRWCRNQPTCPKFEKLICLGTPHHGTRLASLVPSRGAEQLRPGNAWLETLNAGAMPEIISVYGMTDGIVIPSQHAEAHPSPNNHVLNDCGHFTLLYREDVAETIRDIVRPSPS